MKRLTSPRLRASPRGKLANFIVMEGPDKSGKSTQAFLLARRLRRAGLPVVHTREPGGTPFAEAVRRLLLDPRHRVEPMAELLLYEAARAQHTKETILPALRAGKIVISERYTLASLVYQGCARGLGIPKVRTLNRIASYGLQPRLTLVFDVPDSEFTSRKRRRAHDRLEREKSSFRRRVRSAYKALSRTEPRTTLLDGRKPVEELHGLVLRKVLGLLGLGRHMKRRRKVS